MLEGKSRWLTVWDLVMLVVSLAVLLLCLSFLRHHSKVLDYSGLVLDPKTWEVVEADACNGSELCLQPGDQVTDLGGLSLAAYQSEWNTPLYSGQAADGSLDVIAIRDSEKLRIRLTQSHRRTGSLVRTWGIPLLFWAVGAVVILLVRPRNVTWVVLILLFQATALWISAGALSPYHLAGSMYVYHGIIWYFLPLLIHTHLLVPYPILSRWRKWSIPALYLAASVLLILDLQGRLSQRVAMAWVGVAALAAFSLLGLRLLLGVGPTRRMMDRILFFGVMVGLLPVVFFALVPIIADSETRRFVMMVARTLLAVCLPVWPLSYLYALSKSSPGPIELRANRLLGAYGFLCLFVTSFIALFVLGDRWVPGPSGGAAWALSLSLIFVIIAPSLRRRFQRLVDRVVYGIKYLPEELVGVFAARIPRATDIANLRKILVEEVAPTLMIRESALYVLNEVGVPEELFRSGDAGSPPVVPDEVLRECLELEMPTRDAASPSWVRLAVPLHGRERTLGVWLLGRRDPDDLYPKSDRELLHNIANQIAPVVENIRLVERARQEVEENRKLQQQLIQSQKMEAIGRLSAGVAHDFNNLLSVILGYCSLLAVKYRGDETLISYLDDIRDAGDRAAALTRQLLAFSRQQVMEARSVHLNDVVGDVERMLERLTGEDVEVVINVAADLPRVRIDSAQMGQVVMNLAVNARDAMPSGGRFELTTAFLRLSRALVDPIQGEIPAGDYVTLCVTDTGVGMPADQLHRIFEPYFTTKELGKGTGLGLSMVYGIVSQFKGYIRVESLEGAGTTFSIYLPALVGDESSVGIRLPSAGEEVGRGTETILLVEDEDSVRHVAQEILESQGYHVISAADGILALQAYDRLEERLDLLLTDVVMPRMKGTDLAEQLTRKQPDLPVLFMSGYNEEAVFSGWRSEERPPLIAKPFSPASLVTEIRRILDRAETTRAVAIFKGPV